MQSKKIELKNGVAQANKLLMEMKKKWEFLPGDSKAQYKFKITKFQERYQKISVSSKRITERLDDEQNRAKLNMNAHKGVSTLIVYLLILSDYSQKRPSTEN